MDADKFLRKNICEKLQNVQRQNYQKFGFLWIGHFEDNQKKIAFVIHILNQY